MVARVGDGRREEAAGEDTCIWELRNGVRVREGCAEVDGSGEATVAPNVRIGLSGLPMDVEGFLLDVCRDRQDQE